MTLMFVSLTSLANISPKILTAALEAQYADIFSRGHVPAIDPKTIICPLLFSSMDGRILLTIFTVPS